MSKPSTLANQVVDAIQSVVGSDPAVLHEPRFNGNEWAYVKECIDTGWVSSAGEYVGRFESMLAEYTGVKHVVATVNGTAALHICLKLAGVRQGDEVLVPSLTFVATANAVSYCGAIPHFADSDETTLGIDPHKLEQYLEHATEIRGESCFNKLTGRPITAIVVVHIFGHPAALQPLIEICKKYQLNLIEDAAEALGSYYDEKHTGNFGLISSVSFNGNKIITTGGGGAILTNNLELAKQARHITTTARIPDQSLISHDQIGYNYRLPNLNAALGCAQLEQLSEFLESKRELFERYKSAFANVPELNVVAEPAGCRSNYWLQTLMLDESAADQKDAILAVTNDRGLMTRPVWTLMHRLEPYRECPKMELPVAESLEKRLINLPSSARLGMGGER